MPVNELLSLSKSDIKDIYIHTLCFNDQLFLDCGVNGVSLRTESVRVEFGSYG